MDYAAHLAFSAKCFDLVSPNLRGAHWKDAIAHCVADAALASAGVTIDDVKQAVVDNTATLATAERCTRDDGSLGWFVTAPGYWAGPAAG